MSLTAVTVEQFKCFSSLRLTLGGLTLLTGYNAAGKSTSLQPLLLLAQSSRLKAETPNLELNGALTRLGTAGEVLARSNGKSLRFGFEAGEESVRWQLRASNNAGSHALETIEILIRSGSAETTLEGATWPRLIEAAAPVGVIQPIRSVVYLGATRSASNEVSPMANSSAIHADVGVSGEFAPWWYAQYVDEEIPKRRRHHSEEGTTLRRQLDAYLADLFPGGQANAEPISRTALTRLTFRSSTQSDWLRPVHIGYGLSYAFPILVALLLAQDDQIIVLDSPEAHLHPRGQSQMGRILAKFASAGVQLLVETHSDHVLNGARLAVRDGTIAADQFFVHFFGYGAGNETKDNVSSPRVDNHGALSCWPSGFFDQAEEDLSTLSGFND